VQLLCDLCNTVSVVDSSRILTFDTNYFAENSIKLLSTSKLRKNIIIVVMINRWKVQLRKCNILLL